MGENHYGGHIGVWVVIIAWVIERWGSGGKLRVCNCVNWGRREKGYGHIIIITFNTNSILTTNLNNILRSINLTIYTSLSLVDHNIKAPP